jgi:hypothetical protein
MEFDGVLDARTLFSLVLPETVTYRRGDMNVTEPIDSIVGGTLTLLVNRDASFGGRTELEVLEVLEDWDRESATWTVRIDTAGVTELWQTPGGTVGSVLGSEVRDLASDTIRIGFDAEMVAVWADSAGAERGGLLRLTDPERRIFFSAMGFQYHVIPAGADTVVNAAGTLTSTIIVTPEDTPPPPGVLRVGGLPIWRSMLRFETVVGLRIPCGPGHPESCTLGLDEVTVNSASLLLYPVPAGPRRLERPLLLEARGVLQGPNTPLPRSPLTPPLAVATDTVRPEMFVGDPDPPPVRVPITALIHYHLDPPVEGDPPLWVALTAMIEGGQFGYAAFGGIDSDRPPKLRLLVSVLDEELVR